jgi:hypothetical protein
MFPNTGILRDGISDSVLGAGAVSGIIKAWPETLHFAVSLMPYMMSSSMFSHRIGEENW